MTRQNSIRVCNVIIPSSENCSVQFSELGIQYNCHLQNFDRLNLMTKSHNLKDMRKAGNNKIAEQIIPRKISQPVSQV
jgi:hypothetical protein